MIYKIYFIFGTWNVFKAVINRIYSAYSKNMEYIFSKVCVKQIVMRKTRHNRNIVVQESIVFLNLDLKTNNIPAL